MNIIETTFEKLPTKCLLIGFEGENLRATVRIDCASVFAEYPNATPTLIVKPLFADAYPVVVDRNGTDVDWLITSEILSFSGYGEIQLVFYKDQVICKSAVSKIRVSRSLTVTGDMPDPVVQWIENANRKLAEVDAQIVELEEMVDTATDAAERAEQSASTASTAAEQAAGSAATATEKATEATNAAGTATAKAAEAQTAAQTATEKANAAAESERIATAKAGEATTAAGTATTKATEATEAAQTATEKAGDASASATAAHASATNAASSATAASASETAAKASETAASTSASQAAQSVQDAGANAQTAIQKAAEASQSASNAVASATNAATSAETASTKAGEAAQSAQAVAETAEQLAESLEQISQNTADIAEHEQEYNALKAATLIHNTASGAIASFSDSAEMPVDEVTAQINPVQDLHGYDHPWPAGGGKNLLNINRSSGVPNPNTSYESPRVMDTEHYFPGMTRNNYYLLSAVSNISISETDIQLEISAGGYGLAFPVSAKPQTSYTISFNNVSNGKVSLGYYSASWGFLGHKDGGETPQYTIQTPEDCAYISVIVTAQNIGTAHVKNIQLELGSTATAWSPYSNICPITGHTGVNVTRTGKNLLPIPTKTATLQSGVVVSASEGKLQITGTGKSYGIYNIDLPYAIPAGTQMVLNGNVTGNDVVSYRVRNIEGNNYEQINLNAPKSVSFAVNRLQVAVNPNVEYSYTIENIQLEIGSVATAYEPYNGIQVELPFGQTVYGGTIDLTTGVLAVDRASVDMGTLIFYKSSAVSSVEGSVFSIPLANVGNGVKPRQRYAPNMVLSEAFMTCNADVWWINQMPDNSINVGTDVLLIACSKYDNIESFRAAMQGVLLVYELANPISYTLTASEITTLLGENNLWHDANGDISVGYKANTKLYIDEKIAELVAQIVNS